eukprot:2473851-Prymnesium_polylepis.1
MSRQLSHGSHQSPPPPIPPPAPPPHPPFVPVSFAEHGALSFAGAGGTAAIEGDARFGEALDLSPDLELLAVGAPCASVHAATRALPGGTPSALPCAGAVHLLQRTGFSWTPAHTLSASDAAIEDATAGPLEYLRFGGAVAFWRSAPVEQPLPPASPPVRPPLCSPEPPPPPP